MSSNLKDIAEEWGDLTPSRDLNVINKRLMDLRKKGKVHIIGPGVGNLAKLEVLPESYHVSWHCFLFDPWMNEYGSGPHFYHDASWAAGMVAMKREALLELWNSADGRFIHSERNDDATHPHYARYTWCGSVLTLSGIAKPDSATVEIDLRDGAERTIGMKAGMLKQQRINISMITESKAQNRVIRKLLGISQGYTVEEAAWPFVLMKLQFIPDMKDPMTRLLVTANAIGASAAVFGGPNGGDLMRALLASKVEQDEPPRAALTAGAPPAPQPQLPTGPIGPTGTGHTDGIAGDFLKREEVPSAPTSAQGASLPFEEPAEQPPVYKIDNIKDYEALEEKLARGQIVIGQLSAALTDLHQRRYPQLKLNTPFVVWETGHRRIFVEKALAQKK